MDVMQYIWIAAIVLLAILEGATAQLVCIWFVIGGIAALVTSIFTDVIWIQLTVFVAVSILSLLITRPLVKRAMSFQKEDTNAGRIVGQKGIVTEAVENDQGERPGQCLRQHLDCPFHGPDCDSQGCFSAGGGD